MVTLEFIVSEKTEAQTDKKHTNKQTNKQTRSWSDEHGIGVMLNEQILPFFGVEVSSSKIDRGNAFFIKLSIHDLLLPSWSPQVTGHGVK